MVMRFHWGKGALVNHVLTVVQCHGGGRFWVLMTVKSGGRTIRTSGTRSSFKKAIVTLHEGDRIDLVGGEVTV